MDEPEKELSEPSGSGEIPTKLRFEYEKSNYFRTIHVDGAHGGIAPDGISIVMSVFSERSPIPKVEEYDVSPTGQLVALPMTVESRNCIFREVEATMVMDHATATMVYKWLGDKLIDQRRLLSMRAKMAAGVSVKRAENEERVQ